MLTWQWPDEKQHSSTQRGTAEKHFLLLKSYCTAIGRIYICITVVHILVTNFSQNSQQKGSLYLSPDHMHLRINMWISRLNKYLRLRISTFEQRDTEQNAFWENPVISGVHYHIYDQFWGTFFVQEALDIKHGHPRLICILSWKSTCKLDKYTNPIHVCFTHIYENEPISSHKAHNSNIINLILKFCQPKSPLIKRRFLYEIPVLGSKNKK